MRMEIQDLHLRMLRIWRIVLGTTLHVLGIRIMLILKKKKETSD